MAKNSLNDCVELLKDNMRDFIKIMKINREIYSLINGGFMQDEKVCEGNWNTFSYNID
jgi:hypothetical protein